ncbi:TraB/GumN family protein [Winogradskyella vidalii]|uniref:TraB/GumN family protein n=1 Tax=Winogradskyella vidalii TaxID=2615024 RepID=UPI0015CCDCDA|nr:TraB/GumN family protein [Winogradskyella vidalii]
MRKLNQITFVIVVFIATTFNIVAQNNTKTNLWKIEGNDIKTSYLFGTIHMIPKKDFIMKNKVQSAFDSSEKVVLELDMDDPNYYKDFVKLSMLKEGESLKSYMSDAEFEILNTYLMEKTGVGVSNYNMFKPMMLMSVFTMTTIGGEPLESYEMSLINMAKTANKEVSGLENIADQINAFDADPYDEQIDTIVEMVSNGNSQELYNKLLQYYLAEDIDGIYDFMDDYMQDDTEGVKRFLDDRNNKWIPKIEAYSKDNSVFYAVGCGHLGGEQGVINLLKNAGYTVTPIID